MQKLLVTTVTNLLLGVEICKRGKWDNNQKEMGENSYSRACIAHQLYDFA